MNVGDLWVGLRVDSAAFQSEITNTMRAAGTVASKSFSDNFKIAAGAVGVIGTAIAGIGLNAAIDWESAFAGVRKTVDATDAELLELNDTLRNMAGELGFSAVELAGLAEQAGALGIKTPDIAEFVRIAAMLGVTTDVSASDAATALGKINAVIPLTRDEMERFASTLVDLGNKGESTEPQILDMAQNMAGAAAVIHMSTPQMLGWAAAAANVGIEAEAGSSSFQRFGMSIQRFVATGAPQLKTITDLTGMTEQAFKDLWGKDSSAALQAIIQGLAGMDGATRQATLAALGFTDIRLTKYLLTLSANQDNLNESLLTGVSAWEDNTAIQVEFGERSKTVETEMAKMRAELNEVAIIIGEALLPHFRNFIVLVKDLAQGIGNWMRENKGLVDTLTPILAVLSGILALKWGGNFLGMLLNQLGLRGLGQMLIKAVIPSATAAGTAAGAAQAAAHGTAATGQGLVTRVVAGILALSIPGAAAGTTVGTAIGAATAVAIPLGIVAGLAGIATFAPMILAKLFGQDSESLMRNAGAQAAGYYAAGFSAEVQATYAAKFEAAMQASLDNRSLWDKLWNNGMQPAADAGVAAGNAYLAGQTAGLTGETVTFDFPKLIRTLMPPEVPEAAGTEGGERTAASFHNAFQGNWSGAVFDQIVADFQERQRLLVNEAAWAGAETPRAFSQGLRSAFDTVRTAFTDLKDLMKNTLSPAAKEAELIGIATSKRLAKALNDGRPEVRGEAQQIALDTIAELVKLNPASTKIGTLTTLLLARALPNERPALQRAIDGIINVVENPMQDLAQNAGTYGSQIGSRFVGGIKAALAQGYKSTKDAFLDYKSMLATNSPPPPANVFYGIDKWGWNTAKAWVDGMVAGFRSGRADITAALGLTAPSLTPAFAAIGQLPRSINGTQTLHHEHTVRLDLANAPAGITNDGVARIVYDVIARESVGKDMRWDD